MWEIHKGTTGLYKHHRGSRIVLWCGKERFIAAEKATRNLLNAVEVLALEAPADTLFGELRARLEEPARPSVQMTCS